MAIAHPIDTSNSASGAGTAAPGGPSGIDEVTVIAKSPARRTTATAWTKCKSVRPRFHERRPARRSCVTPVATGILSFLFIASPPQCQRHAASDADRQQKRCSYRHYPGRLIRLPGTPGAVIMPPDCGCVVMQLRSIKSIESVKERVQLGWRDGHD